VPTGRVLALEKQGWTRGEPVGHGCYVEVTRPLASGRARLTFMPGIYLGDPMMNPQQAIDTVQLETSALPSAVELSDLVEGVRVALGHG
jgi:hypothetical protein